MDNNDGSPPNGGEPAMDAGDWRNRLQADSRQRIVNKIMDTLKRHLPFSGQEGLHELKKIAVRFEEKIYTAATSQSDYLRKISLKMLTMETKSQTKMANSLQSNSAGSSGMQPQVTNQGQLLSENIQSNIPPAGVQNSAGLSSALPPTSWLSLSSVRAPTPALNTSALLSALPPAPRRNMPASLSSVLPSPQDVNSSSSSFELFPICGLVPSKKDAVQSDWKAHSKICGASEYKCDCGTLFSRNESFITHRAFCDALAAEESARFGSTSTATNINIPSFMPDSSSALPPAFSLDLLTNYHRQMQGQQQVVPQQQQQQQQQQSEYSQQRISQQQIQQELIRNIQQQQKQQQMLLQKKPLSSSQQSHVQSASSAVESFICRLQQNQQLAISQLTQPMLQQTAMPQQQILPPQHQQQQLTASLDSTAQIQDKNGADWQEEVYQKIKVMKETYLTTLREIYQKNATKLQQLESLPQQPKSYQLEKLKMLKTMLEHLITVLQVSKSNISPVLKWKLGLYEKQIIAFINTNRPKKLDSSLQQGHLPSPRLHSIEHSQSQITQVQSHENHMSPQLHSMNLQGSVATMQQNNVTGLQQNYVSSLSGVSTAQQNPMNPLQSSSNTDPGQGNPLYSSQQVPVSSIQEICVSGPQQANKNALSSQSGINMLQANINPLQSNSDFLHNRYLQQGQQLKQIILEKLNEQRQPQEQLMQKQQQQIFQQQQQLLPGQLEPQLHQISVVTDMNMNPLSSSQSGSDMLQGSIDSLKSNSGMVDNQCQKQEAFSVNLKQLYPQLQMQQQWMQKPQMLQEKQQQQIQQLQQQAKQRLHLIYFIYLIFLVILYIAAVFGKGYWI